MDSEATSKPRGRPRGTKNKTELLWLGKTRTSARRRDSLVPVNCREPLVTATVTTRSRSLCPDPEKTESSDNSQSKSLTLTRTPRKKYYLVGNSINKLKISKLPKKDAVLARLLDIRDNGQCKKLTMQYILFAMKFVRYGNTILELDLSLGRLKRRQHLMKMKS
jgi:hypothetical protein